MSYTTRSTTPTSLVNSTLTNVFVPIDHHLQPSKPLPLNPLTKNRTNERTIAEPFVPFSVRMSSRPTEHHLPHDLAHSPSSTPQMLQPALTEREHLIIMAGIIVTIQTQLLTSSSVATTSIPSAILSFSMIFELLGALLAIFLRHSQDSRPSLAHNYVMLRLPVVLILTGIAGLAVVLVMEAFKTRLGL